MNLWESSGRSLSIWMVVPEMGRSTHRGYAATGFASIVRLPELNRTALQEVELLGGLVSAVGLNGSRWPVRHRS